MEFIDRYLQSVKSALPKRQREDVIRELTDEVLSRVEEKEQELGRPLTEEEQVTLLKQLGHPWLLASRYRQRRYLIEPSLFALYWVVLRLVLVITFFGMTVAAISLAVSGHDLGASLRIFWQYPMAALKVFAWITLAFVVLDIVQAKLDFFSKWDPRSLPKLPKKGPSTSETVVGMVFSAVFGVWWLVGLKHQFWIFGPGIAYLQFGPVFQTVYPLYVVAVLADVLRHVITLLRPSWERGRFAIRMIWHFANLAALAFLVRAQDLLAPGYAMDSKLQTAMRPLNQIIHLCLVGAIFFAAGQVAWELYKTFFRHTENGKRVVAL